MNNFTPRAQQVLALARKEADRLKQNFVGTEHLLLGLIRLGQGTAFTVLEKMGIDFVALRAEVERWIGAGPCTKFVGNVPYTPRVKKVLALANREAKELKHACIGTEHVLLGLLREGDGVAARVLKNFGVGIECTRKEILKELTTLVAWRASAAADTIAEELTADPSSAVKRPWWKEVLLRGPVLDHFTLRAQQALVLSRQEADRRHDQYIGTEHLLLGLVKLGHGVTAEVLLRMGIDLETVRREAEKLVGVGAETQVTGNIPYTPRAKEALFVAVKEARKLNHSYVCTEHLLLGLLAGEKGVGARVLHNLKVDFASTRTEAYKELDPNYLPPVDKPDADPPVPPSKRPWWKYW